MGAAKKRASEKEKAPAFAGAPKDSFGLDSEDQYIPPMPPRHAAAGRRLSSFSLISETRASVVSIRPAIGRGVLSSAVLVTLAGSMTPALTRSSTFSVAAL